MWLILLSNFAKHFPQLYGTQKKGRKYVFSLLENTCCPGMIIPG